MPEKRDRSLYGAWRNMRSRCLNPNVKAWNDYGGRGIKVCDAWLSFDQFASDMGERPSPLHSLDRIDNDGDYTPENCRWATKREQQKNRRAAIMVTIEGKTYRASDLSEQYGVKTPTIVNRVRLGLPFELVTKNARVIQPGDWRVAVAARVAKQRAASHCKYGHPWSAENTSITPQGWKRCKTCHRLKMQRLNAAKRRAA